MRLSKIASGIPLRQTSPASVERYLIERIQGELGPFKDLATITPILKVDSTDADLSGNVSDAFGDVVLDVRGAKVHLPFIIHQKELIPFDEIRFGEQSVPYDHGKLQKLVNALDKKMRKDGDGSSDIGEVVDGKHIFSGNGFLGTIMNIRDEQAGRSANGARLHEGPLFGLMDDSRMFQTAAVDVLDVFGDIMEKMAQVKAIPAAYVDDFVQTMHKKAMEESKKMIDSVSAVRVHTLDTAKDKRNLAKIDADTLADVRRAASGNNIRFPVSNEGMFEYRNGRVYRTIKPWAVNDTHMAVLPIEGIVLDNKNHYFLLQPGKKFMMSLDQPPAFHFKVETTLGLKNGHMYAMEWDNSSLSHPFRVRECYTDERNDDSSPVLSSRHYFMGSDPTRTSSLFREAYRCEEMMPAKNKDDSWSRMRNFCVVVPRDNAIKEIQHFDRAKLYAWIQENAQDAVDADLSRWMVDGGDDDYYLIPASQEFFKLEKALRGHFTEPDGYFKEGPMGKYAAYEGMNQIKLVIEKDTQPRIYGIQWQFVDEGGESQAVQQRALHGLPEEQARRQLYNFGYDHRKVELFFEIAKRNGREATFIMPDVEKAKMIAPDDVATQKSQGMLRGILNATLNSKNFMPLFADAISDGLAGAIGEVAPQSSDIARSVGDWLKTSFETAKAIEKVATDFQGPTWHEVSALLNLKYRLDKVANDVVTGNYVSGAHDVFEKAASLRPAIAKHTRDLIDFNRQQLLSYDKALIAPKLVKSAVDHLSGLYFYGGLHEKLAGETKKESNKEPDEKPTSLSKIAGLFSGYNNMGGVKLGERISQYNATIDHLKGEVGQLQEQLRDVQTRIRAAMNTGTPHDALGEQAQSLQQRIAEKNTQMLAEGASRNEIQQTINNRNTGVAAAVVLPASLGIGYGYEAANRL